MNKNIASSAREAKTTPPMRILSYFLLLLMFSSFSAIASTAIASDIPSASVPKPDGKVLKQQLKKELKLYKQERRRARKTTKQDDTAKDIVACAALVAVISTIVFALSRTFEGSISYWQALLWTSIGLGLIFAIIILTVSISLNNSILSGW
jgi:hypothetical protein